MNFDVSREDLNLIQLILDRESTFDVIPGDRSSNEMDYCALQAQGADLDLQKMLDFDDTNFAHDAYGIHANIDRTTGKLGNLFLPRCSR